MSDILTIRALIGDQKLYDRATGGGDGSSVEFQVPNFPIVPDSQAVRVDASSKTEGTDYTMDDEIGLLTMTSAPSGSQTVIITYKYTLLTDIQLQSFLDLESGDVKLAAADALDSIASTQALILKVMKVLDLQTDGAKLADALHRQAQDLRKQVLDAELQGSEFDYAEQINDAPGFYEKVVKDMMRQG